MKENTQQRYSHRTRKQNSAKACEKETSYQHEFRIKFVGENPASKLAYGVRNVLATCYQS